MIKDWLTRLLFDWVFVLLYRLFSALLYLVHFTEQIFDVFAGLKKVSYNGQRDYLINVFFGQSIIATVFWGMTAIGVVLCFAFTTIAVARKILDIGGSIRQSLGQILNGALRACVNFLFVSVICIASINLANICLIQINDLMANASTILNETDGVRDFTKETEENAAMTRIMNTIANYSLNSTADNRYNINVCFNSIREDLIFLKQMSFFDYEYPMTEDGHHTWQSAIYLIASSADITKELELQTVDAAVTESITTVMDEIRYNPNFRPAATATRPENGDGTSIATTIFLVSGMTAANSELYNTDGSFDDALRAGYLNGSKDYMDLTQVRKDFDIWNMRYDVGYISCIVFIVILAQCTFLFILRLFDLLLLYLAAPVFAATIPLDDGTRFQTWRQAFTIKIVSGFGSVMAMRLYLILIQILMNGKLRFFDDSFTNYLCQVLFILGGAYAVLKASPVLTQIVAGNSMAAANSEGLSAALGGVVGAKMAQVATRGLGVTAAIAQAPGNMYRNARQSHVRYQARRQARHMSNEALGIAGGGSYGGGSYGGGSYGGGFSDASNAAQLLSPQNRGMGGGAGGAVGGLAVAGAVGGLIAGSVTGGSGGGAPGGSGGGGGTSGGSGSGGNTSGGSGGGGTSGGTGNAAQIPAPQNRNTGGDSDSENK